MSTVLSFSEDGLSEIRAFASFPLNDAFRRLPTNTQTFIGLSTVILQYDISVPVCSFVNERAVCPSLCSRWRFDGPREVRLALFQESRERLFCVLRTDLRTELFVLSLHRSLDLLAKWLLHQPLAGLQRACRLRRQLPGGFGCSRQHLLVG